MPKPKKINLNQWERVQHFDDLDGYTSLILIPKRLEDGTQLPELLFRRGQPKEPLIEDVSTATWFKDCQISNKGSNEEYAVRVDWWFDNAMKDEEYKQIMNDTFNRHNFDVKMSWEKARARLKAFIPSCRKTFIHKYIWKWLSRGIQWQIGRLEKERQ